MMRRIFSFRVLVDCCCGAINRGQLCVPGGHSLLSSRPTATSGSLEGRALKLGGGEAQYLKPSAKQLSKVTAKAKERLRGCRAGFARWRTHAPQGAQYLKVCAGVSRLSTGPMTQQRYGVAFRLNTVVFVGRVPRLNTAVATQQRYGVSLKLNTTVFVHWAQGSIP
jgi:hypothetical protein